MSRFEVHYIFQKDDATRDFTLPYKIYDSQMGLKWVEALRQQKNRKLPFYENAYYGSAFYNELETRKAIQDAIDGVNQFKNRKWIDYQTYPDMSHEFLMTLHDEFERYDRLRILKELGASDNVLNALSELNIQIHRYENLFNPREKFHISAIFSDIWRYQFDEEDYNLFSPDLKDGLLYLDYGITGVPVMHAYLSKAKNHPVPQNNFTSGATIYFAGAFNFTEEDKLKEWFHSTHLGSTIDPMKALGYIPLGECILEKPKHDILESILEHPHLADVKIYDSNSQTELDYEQKLIDLTLFNINIHS